MKLGAPLPEWFTPAAQMALEQMAAEDPEKVERLDAEGTLRAAIEERAAANLTSYKEKMTALIDDGDNPMNAHYAVAREVFGAAAKD